MANLTFSEDQIRELVRHGVIQCLAYDPDAAVHYEIWRERDEVEVDDGGFSPTQLTELLNGCKCVNGVIVRGEYEYVPCPNCSELRTLLLKLAGGRMA